MNLIERIKRRWTQAPDRAAGEMPSLYGKSPRLDPVRYIARMCAGEELKLYQKSGRRKNGSNAEALGEHEVYDLLENPCPTFPELDGWTLRYLTFAYIDLVGECGWLKVRDGKRIIALLPIPKAWILEKPTIGNHYYQILPYGTLGGMSLTVAPEDFVYFKDVNLEDPYGNGKGLSESIADELETDEYASKYQKNFFFNDATPPYVVTGYQGNEQGADRLKKTLKEKLGGFRKAREPAILTGAMDIKPIGTSPKELDMVESRKFLRDECLQHYQLPPEVFGIVENSNRATIDSSFYLTQKNVIIPRLRFFERVVNAQLLDEFDDLCCYHDVKIIEDETLNLQVYQFGVLNGCITKEQYCEHFGINPNPEEGHYLIPNGGTFVNVDEEFELPEMSEEEEVVIDENPEGETDNTEEEPEKPEEGKSTAEYMIKQNREHEEWKAKIWHGFNEKALRQEEPFIKSIQKISAKQKADIEKKIKGIEYVNDASVNNAIADYFTKEVDEAVKHGLAKSWLDCMREGRQNAHEAIGKKKEIETIDDVTITNDFFNRWVDEFGLMKSKELNQTTKKKLLLALRQRLAEDIEEGAGLEVMKRNLIESASSVFEELSTVRAKMIARTETGASVNVGQTATYKAVGIEKKEWIATLDQRTRESHLSMDGVKADIDMTFEVGRADGGIDNMQYPLDPNGSAENVVNCRCTVAPIFF